MTTCQICGRPIKANTGKIAHHGYQRPGNGWQTSSCPGARFKPYEESRDRIPQVSKMAKEHLLKTQMALKGLTENPPPTLTTHREDGSRLGKTITAERPADFDPKSTRRTYRRDAYDTIYFDRKAEFEGEIKQLQSFLAALAKRYAEWKAPEAEEAPFEFDADCPACLRHMPHGIQEHEAALKRSLDLDFFPF